MDALLIEDAARLQQHLLKLMTDQLALRMVEGRDVISDLVDLLFGELDGGHMPSVYQKRPLLGPLLSSHVYNCSYSRMVSCESICLTISITTETTISMLVPPTTSALVPVSCWAA